MRISNTCFGYVFNSLDFIIRFNYTHLGFISRGLNRLLFWNLYASNIKQLDNNFEKTLNLLGKNGINLKGITVLELGPGNSRINALNFLNNGAKNVVLVDKFPRTAETYRQIKYREKEVAFIEQKNKSNIGFKLQDNTDDRIKVFNCELMQADVNNIDLIFSKSVFEHIRDVEGNVKKCHEILKSDGYMFHTIDLRDHYNFNRPFLFYKYSNRIWETYLTKEGLSYTNRYRFDDFIRVFTSCGFQVVHCNTERFPMVERKINPAFGNRADLDIGKMEILLKKQ